MLSSVVRTVSSLSIQWKAWASRWLEVRLPTALRMHWQSQINWGYPVVLRPAYTMGGEGGGLVYNVEELKTVCARGLQASMVGQVLVEESILGWEELELEVVRDAKNNMITVCFIENIDPLGVHTGDSFCSAPMLTISEEVQKRLQEKSYKIVGSNPGNRRYQRTVGTRSEDRP